MVVFSFAESTGCSTRTPAVSWANSREILMQQSNATNSFFTIPFLYRPNPFPLILGLMIFTGFILIEAGVTILGFAWFFAFGTSLIGFPLATGCLGASWLLSGTVVCCRGMVSATNNLSFSFSDLCGRRVPALAGSHIPINKKRKKVFIIENIR